MLPETYNLYPSIEPFKTSTYASDSVHNIYFEESGNLAGYPVVFLHGGPGGGCNPNQRRFFDPNFYRIILVDQRGCGRSTPQGEIVDNNTDLLVADLEGIRELLKIDQWLVFGGSWGSTLALAYAIAHPNRVSGLVLRGIFLSRASELQWFLRDAKQFFPEAWQKLLEGIPASEHGDPLNAYAKLVFSDDAQVSATAATNWNAYEGSIMSLLPPPPPQNTTPDAIQVARARVQIHYILHQCFVGQRDWFAEVAAIQHIPTIIVQGRYDMVCPPTTAWELSQALPDAEFEIVPDAGHSAMEPGVISALVGATEKFKARILKRD